MRFRHEVWRDQGIGCTSYELAVKSRTLENKLILDLAVYRLDWKDFQLDLPLGALDYRANGGIAQSRGVELAPADAREVRAFPRIPATMTPGKRQHSRREHLTQRLHEQATPVAKRQGDDKECSQCARDPHPWLATNRRDGADGSSG